MIRKYDNRMITRYETKLNLRNIKKRLTEEEIKELELKIEERCQTKNKEEQPK